MNTPRVLRGNREDCWRCADTFVLVDEFSPFDGITYSDARGLWPRPECQILRTIVVADPIAVMHGLAVN